jgi:hypothetical protein
LNLSLSLRIGEGGDLFVRTNGGGSEKEGKKGVFDEMLKSFQRNLDNYDSNNI